MDDEGLSADLTETERREETSLRARGSVKLNMERISSLNAP